MRGLLPQTLFGQTVIALLLGIALALAAGARIYGSAGVEAVRAVGALGAAERIVNLTKLVDEVPADWRERLARGSSDASFKVRIENQKPVVAQQNGTTHEAPVIADFIKGSLGGRDVSVVVTTLNIPHLGPPFLHEMGPGFGPGPHGPMMHQGPLQEQPIPGLLARAGMSWRGLEAAVALADGRWLRVSTTLPDTGPAMSPQLILALAVAAGMIALLTAWAVRRMTAPLATLATAADELGRNVDAPPLPASGTTEVQRASRAFNEMQARLKRMLANRTLMLAAISHDLRTQLTLLRLRAETVETPENRERMLATIGDMEAMLTATLTFARDEAATEGRKRIDLSALLTSIVDDLADAGLAVHADTIPEAVELECKPIALRRAVTNLVDNAVKYGARAQVRLQPEENRIEIIVEDEGPGIPEAELGQVVQPFYRVESSRNIDTGGIGLGLAITAAIAEAHGGRLTLANQPKGGLQAKLVLPR
jgi:signal transduction histidine kinase